MKKSTGQTVLVQICFVQTVPFCQVQKIHGSSTSSFGTAISGLPIFWIHVAPIPSNPLPPFIDDGGFLGMLMGYSYNMILNEFLHVIPENEYDNDDNSYGSDRDKASTSSKNYSLLKIVMMILISRMGFNYSKWMYVFSQPQSFCNNAHFTYLQ